MTLLIVSIPFMILGVAIAVVPVLWGSIHFYRQDRDLAQNDIAANIRQPMASVQSLHVLCPLCASALTAGAENDLIGVVRHHAWREHGIPSDEQILESARSA
jgi:hypothetical protein